MPAAFRSPALVLTLALAACGGGSGGPGPAAPTGSTSPDAALAAPAAPAAPAAAEAPYFRVEKLAPTFAPWSPGSVFNTNHSEFVEAYGATWLMLVGGETTDPAPPSFGLQDFRDSAARVLRIGTDGFTVGDPRLDPAMTVSNQPQEIARADLNGDGFDDWVIGAFGPDTPETPGGQAVVLESGPSGWTRRPLPAAPFPTEAVVAGRMGTRAFVYVSSQLCGWNRHQPYLLVREPDGSWVRDDARLPAFLRQSPGSTCDQQGYIGVAAVDVDGDGHDDLVLGTADEANRVTYPNYRGSIVLFGDGDGFASGRTLALPPTRFDVDGVRNTTVQTIRAARPWNGDLHLVVSYYQANVRGRPAIGGGLQMLRYDRTEARFVDVTDTAFVGHPTFDPTGTGAYPFGGPFNLVFVDVNDDGCVDLVTSRRAGLWVNDCAGRFVWAGDLIAGFARSDRLFPFRAGGEVGFLTPDAGERGYLWIRRGRLLPTPVGGRF
ncbi:MAG: hypothetical protein RJA99_366 [Pseudomonadota bacterium]|jgi:hypothetical protein